MRSSALLPLLAVLFAVPSTSGFTLPARLSFPLPSFAVPVPVDLDATSSTSTSTSTSTSSDEAVSSATYDPSETFTGTPSEADLKLLEQMKEQNQNNDIIRDLDGHPLSREYFAENMGIPTENVESYSCPEKDAFRGLMSNACRVHLHPGGQTAFYKHIVFQTLPHAQEKLKTAPHKLLRDSKSYQVVASFLLSKACQTMMEQTGVRIPKLYHAQIQPDEENPMKSKFSFLFQDFAPANGWYQEWLLCDQECCEVALSTLAKIHAFFWTGSTFWNDQEAAEELERAIWKSGSYVQPKAQNTPTVNQCDKVATEWATKKLRFEKELSQFGYWDNLGERLQSVAKECGRLAHPFADQEGLSDQYKKYRTFTHGDPKQANLLFRKAAKGDDTDTDNSGELQLGLIDFQWSGFGLAATDIAHFITSAVHADRLVDGGEEILMKYYFDELQKYLVEFGAYSSAEEAVQNYSYETFNDQYEIAFLDICRLMIAYTWDRFDEPVEKDDEAGCARTMNKTSYNKSIPVIIWLLARCDEILKSRGV